MTETPAAREDDPYLRGWLNCHTMRTLHDRLDGFAIVDPRDTDPFEFNKKALAEYGITTPAAMYAVARATRGTIYAHPMKLSSRGLPVPDDALPTTADGTPAGD